VSEAVHRNRALAAAAGLTAAVLGARWGLIARFGIDVPYWDQWDGEIERLYFKVLDHSLGLGDLFLPANEHRILFTRLLNLAVFFVKGQRVQNIAVMNCQAVVSVVPVFVFGYVLNRSQIRPLVTALLGLIFIFPMGWENLFWAYQSQVYFAVAFASLALLYIARPNVPFWPIVAFTALGAVNTAAAMFTACTAAVAALLRFWETRERSFVLKAVAFLALTYGVSLLIWHNPGHAALRAQSMAQFLEVFWNYLEWPGQPWRGAGVMVWLAAAGTLPWILLRKGTVLRPEQRFGMFALLWVGMVAVAGASARASGIGSRYFDYLIIGYAAALLAAAPLLESTRWRWPARVYQLALMVPVVVFGLQMNQVSRQIRRDREQMREVAQRALIEGASGGVEAAQRVIESRPDILSYPNPAHQAAILADPRGQYVLRDLRK
jgi:hypothetical protein